MGDESNENLPKSNNIVTLYSADTELCADSVEWCPHEPFQNFFVCANYQLAEDANGGNDLRKKRKGRILLYSVSTDGLKLHQIVETPAVLDQKWCHNKINDEPILGVVNALKTLEIYTFNSEKLELELLTHYIISDDDTETLILSLDWSTGKFSSENPEIVCSDSKGKIHRFKLTNGTLELQNSWSAHDYEAWIVAFYYWDTNIVFSGGDDSIFLKFDLRTGTLPVSKNRTHEAGVTCMQCNSDKEFILATGSYDSQVRFWDIRQVKRPLNLIKMPGPLWRLKWDPFTHEYLLAACMLGGMHIVHVLDDIQTIVESYYEHKNIVYGVDWCHLNETDVKSYVGEGNRIVASCSFYDHLLCVSKLKLLK